MAEAVKAYSSFTSGRANLDRARLNAGLEREQAVQTQQLGEFQAGQTESKANLLQGAQRAAFASQGVVSGAGTSQAVYSASEAMAAQDEMMIRQNARRQAWGLNMHAMATEMGGEEAAREGNLSAVSSLLSGAEKAATLGKPTGGSSGMNFV